MSTRTPAGPPDLNPQVGRADAATMTHQQPVRSTR